MSSHEKSPNTPRLPVLGEGPSAADNHAGAGFGTPREVPPGVQTSLDGPVLHSERVTGPAGPNGWIAGAALGGVMEVVGIALLSRGAPLALISAGTLLAAIGFAVVVTAISFRQLELRVDREGIAWSFGPLFRRRYSLDEVEMFRSRDFVFRKVGGWGIGRAHDGVDVYQVWGANGTVLDLVVTRAGVSRHYLVSTVAPDMVCAALVRANAARKKAA